MSIWSRLGIGHKLALMGVLVLAAVLLPASLHTTTLWRSLKTAERSAAAAPVLLELLEAVRHTQAHRGLAAGVLGGNAGMKAGLDERRAANDRALAALAQALERAGASAPVLSAAKDIAGQWQALTGALGAGTLPGPESFARHSALVSAELGLMDRVMDYFGLSLEAHADLYFLMQASLAHLPWLTEHLGQMRGFGNGLLASGQAGPEARLRLALMMDNAQSRTRSARTQADKALALNPAFAAALAGPLGAALDASQGAITLARSQIIEAAALSYPAPDYFRQTTVGIDAVFDLIQRSVGLVTEGLLANRARDLQVLVATGAALGALAVLLLAAGVWVTRSITRPIHRAVEVASAVAQGDLTQALDARGQNETARLLAALAAMQDGLARVVAAVRHNADQVSTASAEIALGADDLSRRTEQQASTLEETAASMEELTATVSQNADHIIDASRAAERSAATASQAGEAVGGFVATMRGINESSGRIAEIIGVIDGIAFQTNILALNAAVEAARAGEQGRGFAVVAGEVRTLAQRSAQAAREIKDLIADSVARVEAGSTQVDGVRQAMAEVVDGIAHLSGVMAQIRAASEEQRQGVSQIGQAVMEMDQTTQQNAALVEQSAAAADALQQQAGELVRLVAAFRLPG